MTPQGQVLTTDRGLNVSGHLLHDPPGSTPRAGETQTQSSELVCASSESFPTSNPPPPDESRDDQGVGISGVSIQGMGITSGTFHAPPVPLDGLRFSLLGFELEHPKVSRLLRAAEQRGAVFVPHPTPDSVDLLVVHPPFLPMLGSPKLPFAVRAFPNHHTPPP